MKWLWAIIDAIRTFLKDLREANAEDAARARATAEAKKATDAALAEQRAAEREGAAEVAKADPNKPAEQAVAEFIGEFSGKKP
jgi:hypothetical protein